MRVRTLFTILAVLVLSGCGESRYGPTAPGGGGPGTGGLPGAGSGNCVSTPTDPTCLGRGSVATVDRNVVVHAATDFIVMHVPVLYSDAADHKAEAFEAVLVGAAGRFPFKMDPSADCPVVDDLPGVNGVVERHVGTLTGVPPGTYSVELVHGLDVPCYQPPPDADPNALNWMVFREGSVVVCPQ